MKYVGIAIVLILLVGGFFLLQPKKQSTNDAMMKKTTAPSTMEKTNEPTNAMMKEATTGAVKEFTVTGQNFSFEPKEITVNKGDKVKVTFKNIEGFHDWNLDEFNAHAKKIGQDKEESVEFTADKTGTFEYYCSVGNHRQMGMVGKFIVK